MVTKHYTVQVKFLLFFNYDIDDEDERKDWEIEQEAADLADNEMRASNVHGLDGYDSYELDSSYAELISEDEDEVDEVDEPDDSSPGCWMVIDKDGDGWGEGYATESLAYEWAAFQERDQAQYSPYRVVWAPFEVLRSDQTRMRLYTTREEAESGMAAFVEAYKRYDGFTFSVVDHSGEEAASPALTPTSTADVPAAEPLPIWGQS